MGGETDFVKRQRAPSPGQTDVSPLLIKDIEARNAHGLKKYGTRLQTHNGRDALVDLYEELVDATQYARQVIEEDLYGKLKRVRDILRKATKFDTPLFLSNMLIRDLLNELEEIPNLDEHGREETTTGT